ncbi:MAG: hypothetical protein HYU53_08065 [Acidobacteria bacterium]|nr:hypothetical protein [Acidobacteriota bacterium]
MADIDHGGSQTHPLEPTRPDVPDAAQPRSVQSHPGHLHEEDGHVAAHEESDVNIRAIGTFIVVLFTFGAVVCLGLLLLINMYSRQAVAADPAVSPLAVPSGTPPPEPRLLTDEPGALRRALAEDEPTLRNIDAAKQAVVGTLPARAGTAAPKETPGRRASRMDTSSGRRQ